MYVTLTQGAVAYLFILRAAWGHLISIAAPTVFSMEPMSYGTKQFDHHSDLIEDNITWYCPQAACRLTEKKYVNFINSCKPR